MVSSTYSKNVLIIAGPTASGKSHLALEIARHLDGVIINADSQQIYAGLPILSAQPSEQDFTDIPHKLYGVLSPLEKCSAAQWKSIALIEIYKAQAEKKMPIVVGGTGLYLKALYDGLHTIPDVALEIRQKVLSIPQENLHQELAGCDPLMAQRLHTNDTQRLRRALEIMMETGRSQAEWILEEKAPPPDQKFFKILILPDKEVNKERAKDRIQSMFTQGVVQEVENFYKTYSLDTNQTIGFQAIMNHIKNQGNLDETIAEVHIKTRQYIKRQRTWFKHQFPFDLCIEDPLMAISNQCILSQIKSCFPV